MGNEKAQVHINTHLIFSLIFTGKRGKGRRNGLLEFRKGPYTVLKLSQAEENKGDEWQTSSTFTFPN